MRNSKEESSHGLGYGNGNWSSKKTDALAHGSSNGTDADVGVHDVTHADGDAAIG